MNSVCKDQYTVLCAARWSGWTWHLDFGVRFYGGSELSKHLSKCLPRMRKRKKSKISEAACKRDWHNVRSYLFFNVQKFRTKNSDSLCNGLNSPPFFLEGTSGEWAWLQWFFFGYVGLLGGSSCVGVDRSRIINIFCFLIRPTFSVMCGLSAIVYSCHCSSLCYFLQQTFILLFTLPYF